MRVERFERHGARGESGGFDLDEKEERETVWCLEEAVTGRVVHPWVIIRTTDAGLKVDGLPGYLLRGELASVGHPAGLSTVDHALLPPGLEVLRLCDSAGVLDPLDHLGHRDEVHVVVVGEDLVDPEEERVQELGVVLQPGGVEVETQGGAVLLVMPVEVVVEEVVELVAGQDVAARVHHGAPRQVLVVLRILATVQLVHHHLPDSVRPGGRDSRGGLRGANQAATIC